MNQLFIYQPNRVTRRWQLKLNGKAIARSLRVADLLKHSKVALLSASKSGEKIVVGVKEGSTILNESVPSSDHHYLLNILTCFVEDEIDEKTFNKFTHNGHAVPIDIAEYEDENIRNYEQ